MKRIQVLGPGCAKCENLKQNAEEAVQQSGVEATIEKVSDINEITSFGVMMTPALVVDEEVSKNSFTVVFGSCIHEEKTNIKRISIAALAVVSIALLAPAFPNVISAADAPADRVVAIYFHRTERCPTCKNMGSYSEEAVKTGFANGIKDGTVAFYRSTTPPNRVDGPNVRSPGSMDQPLCRLRLHLGGRPFRMLCLNHAKDRIRGVTPHAPANCQAIRGTLGPQNLGHRVVHHVELSQRFDHSESSRLSAPS